MDAGILRGGLDRIDDLALHRARERIAAIGAVERDAQHAIDLLDKQRLIALLRNAHG